MPGGVTGLWDIGTWDEDLYDGAAPAPAPPYTTPGFCPPYTRFMLSGVNLGLYIFETNPSKYNAYPQKRTGTYSTVLQSDPTVDETYNKFEIQVSWKRMPHKMWEQIQAYSRKEVDGTSEDIYFWDAGIQRFIGGQVKIESLKAKVRGGTAPLDRFDVSMMLREI